MVRCDWLRLVETPARGVALRLALRPTMLREGETDGAVVPSKNGDVGVLDLLDACDPVTDAVRVLVGERERLGWALPVGEGVRAALGVTEPVSEGVGERVGSPL